MYHLIKTLDIIFVTTIYFVLSFFISGKVQQHVGQFDPEKEKHKSKYRSLSEVLFYIILLTLIVFIVRNIVQSIPSPLDGLYGFKHSELKELTSATIFVYVLFFYQDYLKQKMRYSYHSWFNLPKEQTY